MQPWNIINKLYQLCSWILASYLFANTAKQTLKMAENVNGEIMQSITASKHKAELTFVLVLFVICIEKNISVPMTKHKIFAWKWQIKTFLYSFTS